MAADENRSESTAGEEDAQLGRRHVLTLLAVAAPTLAAACAMQSGDLPADNQDPENVGGDAGDPDTGTVDTGSGVPDTGGACGTGVNVGPVTNFVVGQWKRAGSGSSAFNIGRDAKGIWAYTTTCTHQPCTVGAPSPTTGAIRCPCHGATFDGNGAVTKGPAARPLNNYEVTICAGNVYVNRARIVPSGTRAPA
jgi:Rieske Fe-S protein